MTVTATDQFCGAGGTTEGATAAGVDVKVALNHWRLAIETHNTNHPETLHDCADISQVDPRRYPRTDILLTSPECTNHTLAKNHKQAANELTLWDPKKEAERSRATMWDVPRFAEYHRYKLIVVENVIEVRSWAPYEGWLMSMHNLGYQHDFVYFNSRFAGVPQSRDRLYTILWQSDLPTPDLDFRVRGFCQHCEEHVDGVQTWTSDFDQAMTRASRKMGRRPERLRWGNYDMQYHYACPTCQNRVEPAINPAWTAIDWTLDGKLIGDASLAANTLTRIQKGIDKYGNMPVAIPLDHLSKPDSKMPYPVWRPFATQTGRQDTMLVNAFLAKLAGSTYEHPGSSCRTWPVTDEFFTQTTTSEAGLIGMPFLAELRGGGSDARAVSDPAATVCASGNHHMLIDGFVRNAFYDKGFTSKVGGADMVKSVAQEFGTVTTRDHHGLVQVPLVDHFYGAGVAARPVTESFGTQTTLARFGLVEGDRAIDINDCTYRMLQPHEIQRVMAFRDSYQVLGTQRDKVRQLGNAVTPPVSTMLLNRLVPVLFDNNK